MGETKIQNKEIVQNKCMFLVFSLHFIAHISFKQIYCTLQIVGVESIDNKNLFSNKKKVLPHTIQYSCQKKVFFIAISLQTTNYQNKISPVVTALRNNPHSSGLLSGTYFMANFPIFHRTALAEEETTRVVQNFKSQASK